MDRLAYTLIFYNENSHFGAGGSLAIRFVLQENGVGDKSARIYLDGGAAPAFSPLVGDTFYQENGLIANSLYVVEYKDDNGERIVGKVRVYALANSCYNDAGAEQGIIGYIQITTTGINVWTNVRPTSSPARELSIDGGVTWKSTLNANAIISWTNSELEALGVDREMPDLQIKRISSACTLTQAEEVIVEYGFDPLEATYEKTNVTATGADDGTITVTPSGGSGNYSYLWNDAEVTQNRGSLPPGIYSVTITDTETLEEVLLENIEITEAQFEALPEGTLLEFPQLNDLQWVVDAVDPEEDPDNATLDNVLFNNQAPKGFMKSCYFQKVTKSDIRTAQFNSNFGYHTVELRDYNTDELVKQFTIQLKESNIGVTEDFAIQIRNHVDNPGKSRIYFTGNTGALPIPLNVGDVFTVLNNLEGFDGNYSIVSIENDVTMNTQYLVITLNYTGATSISAATGRFLSNDADYNVYEFVHSYADVAEGKYYLKLTALNNIDEGEFEVGKIGITEPIYVKEKWKGTNLIEYINIDNGYGDITWTTGYVGKIRVDSIFGPKRMTSAGERGISRNSNYDAVKTYAKKVRGILFETYMLPPYLHEKLGLIFDCDSFSINGVSYQATEPYADAQYIEEFMLSNSSIKVEQLGWNRKYNSNDIGTVADGGFLLSEQGFLKL